MQWLVCTLLLMAMTGRAAAERLTIEVTGEKGEPLWTRLEVRGADGKMYQPDGAIRDKTARPRGSGPAWYQDHFVVEGKAALDVPAGKYRVIAEHGPEFERREQAVEVASGAPAAVRLSLGPWIRMNDLGWWSGDLHVHRPLADVPALMRTEDLNVAVSYTMWNTQQRSRSDWTGKPAPAATVESVSPRHLHMIMNAEDERGGGAWMMIGLPGPFEMTPAEPWYPQGLTFVERARALRPKSGVLPWFDCEKLIWWEAPVVMAFGAPDSVSLLFNHFNQYGIHDAEAWGRPRDQKQFPGPEGFIHYVLGLHYRYLNLGFPFAQAAGSASGVLPGPPGYNRVYVRLNGALTVEKWFAALRDGDSFVTNGPALFSTFRERGKQVEVSIDARSREPIDRVEVIANGRVLETLRPPGAARRFQRSLLIDPRDHSWLAVRCWQKEVPTFRLAHSTPYRLAGRWDASEDARYFRDWMDELIAITKADAKRFRTAAQRDEILAIYEKARNFYAARARPAAR